MHNSFQPQIVNIFFQHNALNPLKTLMFCLFKFYFKLIFSLVYV